jgi:hypothetical protein
MLVLAWPFGNWETVRFHRLCFCPVLTVATGYLLLGLLSSLVFRAIRNALPGNPAAQERILGASLLALAIADVSHLHNVTNIWVYMTILSAFHR